MLAREAAKFGAVGALSYLIDLLVFNAVLHVLEDKPLTAKVVSTCVSALNAYLLNRHWSFRHRERQSVGRESVLFVVLNAVGLGIALLCLALSHYVLGFESRLADNIAANGVGLVLGTAFRFWSYRRFVWTDAVAVEVAAQDGDVVAGGRPRRHRRPLRAGPPPQLQGLPRPFWFLFGGTLVNRLGAFVEPFLAFYLTRSRGFSIAEAGLVLTLLGLGTACSQALGGVLADRLGRRRTMVLGLCSAAASLLVVGAATTLPALCAAAGLYGLCLDLFRPAVNAATADLVPERDRVRAYALNFWAVNLGFAVAAPLGGYLASRGYWTLFLLDAATSVGFALLILRGVPETRPAPREGDVVGTVRDVLRDRLLLGLVGAVALQGAVYVQAFSTLPLVFGQDGLSPAGYGAALGLNGVLIVVLQPLLLGALEGRDRGRVLLLSLCLLGAGFGLHGLADTVLQHAAAVAVWTLGEVLQAGLLGALVAELAPVHLRGRYAGAFGVSFGLSGAVAPLAGTQLLQHAGQGALWSTCLSASVVAGLALRRVSDLAAVRSRPAPAR